MEFADDDIRRVISECELTPSDDLHREPEDERLKGRRARLQKLLELNAPSVLIEHERRMIGESESNLRVAVVRKDVNELIERFRERMKIVDFVEGVKRLRSSMVLDGDAMLEDVAHRLYSTVLNALPGANESQKIPDAMVEQIKRLIEELFRS
jgi:hypothetical protein